MATTADVGTDSGRLLLSGIEFLDTSTPAQHRLVSTIGGMNSSARHWAALIMLVLAALLLAGRTMAGRATDEGRATLIDAKHPAPGEAAALIEEAAPTDGGHNRRAAIHNLVAEAQAL